ncbi:hypothetical protein Tsubulata_045637 [Turnera subulata]|uniref:Zinc knuckle CX2CX4HX4C domain-containing protein n=1 Tax=Turnera subulata TaxID=218843 RepID=A0A9Q0EZS3_9ROSI|nr:hypothetical protein Tsubulata_045637 [Turnera subulata]
MVGPPKSSWAGSAPASSPHVDLGDSVVVANISSMLLTRKTSWFLVNRGSISFFVCTASGLILSGSKTSHFIMESTSHVRRIDKGKAPVIDPGKEDILIVPEELISNPDNQLLLLLKVSGEEQFSTTLITNCSFWIKVHDIPYHLRTLPFITEVANRLGSFVSTDEKGVLGWGSFIRVRVVLNVEIPLKKEVISQIGSGPLMCFPVSYENFPNFYYACGLIGHLVKECEEFSDVDTDDETELPYGDGLRASPKKPFISTTCGQSPTKPVRDPKHPSPTILKHATIPNVVQDTLAHDVDRTLNLNMSPLKHNPNNPISSPDSTTHIWISSTDSTPQPSDNTKPSPPPTSSVNLHDPTLTLLACKSQKTITCDNTPTDTVSQSLPIPLPMPYPIPAPLTLPNTFGLQDVPIDLAFHSGQVSGYSFFWAECVRAKELLFLCKRFWA